METTWSFDLTEDDIVSAAAALPDHAKLQERYEIVVKQRMIRESETGDDKYGRFASALIEIGERTGSIEISWGRINYHCRLCKKSATQPLYKSGPNRGRPNYNKDRVPLGGVEFNREYTLSMCSECWREYEMVVVAALDKVKFEVRLMGKHITPFRRIEELRCKKCDKTFFEHEGRKLWNGTGCPHCDNVPSWDSLGFEKTKQWKIFQVKT